MNCDGTIQGRGIRKSFGSKTVLQNIDIDIASGEISCIIGPSGSGKSTLLRCVNGLETIDLGVLKVNGEHFGYYETDNAFHALSRKRLAKQRTKVGIVFQQFNLFPNMTAQENIMAGPVLRQAWRQAAGSQTGRAAAGERRLEWLRRPISRAAVRRAAATCGHRTCIGHGSADHAVRRADERPGP